MSLYSNSRGRHSIIKEKQSIPGKNQYSYHTNYLTTHHGHQNPRLGGEIIDIDHRASQVSS